MTESEMRDALAEQDAFDFAVGDDLPGKPASLYMARSEAETPASHLRDALQIIEGWTEDERSMRYENLRSIENRIRMALRKIEAGR